MVHLVHDIADAALPQLARTAAAGALLGHHSAGILRLFFSLGLFGVFLVSIVDSSFIPLPIPGLTDIMIVLIAAQRVAWPHMLLLLFLATSGSAIGGYFSHRVGQTGGMAFLERRVPPRIFRRVTRWMERHAILAVALPAILPPPMPLSPFVLAAGALKMSQRTFMTTFTLSRLLRHAAAIALGIHYGSAVLGLWARFSSRWAEPVLIALWTGILVSSAYAIFKIYSTSRKIGTEARQPAV